MPRVSLIIISDQFWFLVVPLSSPSSRYLSATSIETPVEGIVTKFPAPRSCLSTRSEMGSSTDRERRGRERNYLPSVESLSSSVVANPVLTVLV